METEGSSLQTREELPMTSPSNAHSELQSSRDTSVGVWTQSLEILHAKAYGEDYFKQARRPKNFLHS